MKRSVTFAFLALAHLASSAHAQAPSPQKPASTGAPAASKWTGGASGKSLMDDSPIVVYRLLAEASVGVWLGRARPTLFVRCQEGETETYINFGTASHVESGSTRTVQIRFDQDEMREEEWSQSTDDVALFAPSPEEFAREIAAARRLRVRWIPFNAPPVTVEFDVRGFQRLIGRVAKPCGWDPTPAPPPPPPPTPKPITEDPDYGRSVAVEEIMGFDQVKAGGREYSLAGLGVVTGHPECAPSSASRKLFDFVGRRVIIEPEPLQGESVYLVLLPERRSLNAEAVGTGCASPSSDSARLKRGAELTAANRQAQDLGRGRYRAR